MPDWMVQMPAASVEAMSGVREGRHGGLVEPVAPRGTGLASTGPPGQHQAAGREHPQLLGHGRRAELHRAGDLRGAQWGGRGRQSRHDLHSGRVG